MRSKVTPRSLYRGAVLGDVFMGRNLIRRLPDRPRTSALIALVIATFFVVVRLSSVGNGDIGSFVGAGDYLSGGTDLPLQPGAGYDGQFYYRMAIAPLNFDATAEGVTLDSEMRLQRPGYPSVTWVVSFGGLFAVELALIAVNVLGLALIAGLGGVLARRSGRHALWGLALALYYGFAFTLSKDLTEIVEVSFLLLGLVAAHKQRFVLSGLALGGAVLTRESALFFVPFVAAWRLFVIVRRRQRPSAIDLTWIVPPIMFGAWQLFVHASTGRFPVNAERHNTVNFPGCRCCVRFQICCAISPCAGWFTWRKSLCWWWCWRWQLSACVSRLPIPWRWRSSPGLRSRALQSTSGAVSGRSAACECSPMRM